MPGRRRGHCRRRRAETRRAETCRTVPTGPYSFRSCCAPPLSIVPEQNVCRSGASGRARHDRMGTGIRSVTTNRSRESKDMATSVQMPALGESVTEGTVTRWLKQEGDTVELDEPLLEVSTDKVDTEIPSPAAGVLTKIVAAEDDTVEVGGELAVIGEAGESDGEVSGDQAPAADAPPAEEPKPAEEPAAPAQEPAKPAAAASGQATSVKMPELGESVTEGTVTRWLKNVGDS